MPVFALWSAPRSRSTAFFRSIIERGDLTVAHEPFSDVVALGETDIDGKPFTSMDSLLNWLRDDTDDLTIFVKDTPSPRHRALLEDRTFLANTKHALLIRSPDEIAASAYAIEPTISIDFLGLEFLWHLYEAVADASGSQPLVIDSDDLVQRPTETMAAYCEAMDLPFIESSLSWERGARNEWRRSARWHADVADSTGFHVRPATQHEATAENSPTLATMAAHHQPFYEKLHAQRLRF